MANPTPSELILLSLILVFTGILITCACYLARRAKQTRMTHLLYMSAYFAFTAMYYLLLLVTLAIIPIPWTIQIAIIVIGIGFGILFVKESFFKARRSPFKIIIVAYIIISIIYMGIALMRDVNDGTDLDVVVGRVWITFFGLLDLLPLGLWQAQVSFKEFLKYKSEAIEPHVKARYLLFGISGLVLITTGLVDLVGTMMDVYLVIDYETVNMILLLLVFGFTMLNLFLWVMPGSLKRFLNRKYTAPEPDQMLNEDEIMKQLGMENQEKKA